MAPFDAELTTKISPLIEGQVPDYLQAENPKFVEFLKQYYQFLEAAELRVSGIINNIVLENTDVRYLRSEDGTKIVAESGVGTTGKFIEGELITGTDTKATATVLIDDLDQEKPRLFISSTQKFNIGETVTGATSGASAQIIQYRANPIQNIQQLLDYSNVDNTTSTVLDEMQRQFMDAIPETLANGVSKRNLLKNIKDLYAAKGTSEGHKLFMRLMFAEEAEIFYPTQYMLRASDGNWTKKSVIRCENSQGANGQEVIGQTLVGRSSGASVFVINAVTFAQGSASITEFDVDLRYVVGTFIDGETLTADGLLTFTEQNFTIQKIIASATVDNGGILYNAGDIISISAGGNNAARAQVNTTGVGNVDGVHIDTGGSGYRVGDRFVFTSDATSQPAEGYVSSIGGSFLLENNENIDGVISEDYLSQEENTNWQYADINIGLEEGGSLLIDATDSSGTDENWYFDYEAAVERKLIADGNASKRITFEANTNLTYGEIANVIVTTRGAGYIRLPQISITSVNGTGGKIIPTTNTIGTIEDVSIVDAGFNYKVVPEAAVDAKFIVKQVSGSFSAAEKLTTHTGTVTGWSSADQVLSVSIEDVIRIKMEQETADINENIQLEVNTDNEFNRVLGENAVEGNTGPELVARGLDDVDTTGIVVKEEYRYDIEDQLVLDSDGSTKVTIPLERPSAPGPRAVFNQPSVASGMTPFPPLRHQFPDPGLGGYDNDGALFRENVELEQRFVGPDGFEDTIFDGVTKLPSLTTYSGAFSDVNLLLEGTAVGDDLQLNGTDASKTDAGDDFRQEDGSTGSGMGDKLIQESKDDGNRVRYETHGMVDNLQYKKDKFQLNGTKEQVYTSGGWVDADRATSEELQIVSSHVVVEPGKEGDRIITEDGVDLIVLDGTNGKALFRIGSAATFWEKTLDEGSYLRNEPLPDRYVNVEHPSSRIVDDTDGILLEDASAQSTVNWTEYLILQGQDGTSNSDADGWYTEYTDYKASHGNDDRDIWILEDGDCVLSEESVDDPNGGFDAATLLARTTNSGSRVILDNNIVGGLDDIHIVLDGTDTEFTNAGGYMLHDGFSTTERGGTTLVQESGLAAGLSAESDAVPGDELTHETQSFTSGNIVMNAYDDNNLYAGFDVVTESLQNFIGQTISTGQGTAVIIGANLGKVSVNTGFITTDVGRYSSTNSLISEDVIRIQDSYYYQDFSYEVRIGQSVNTYMNELKRAVHPAGFIPFGKVTIASLMSVSMSPAGIGRVDPPLASFSPVLASSLRELFELRINHRLGIPKVFEQGSLFAELRLENGTSDFNFVLDGTEYGTLLEAEEGGVISLEESHDDGDNICIVAGDDGSQVDAGDNISLDGTDIFGTDNVDVLGEVSSILLDGSNIVDGAVQDAGSSLLLDGSALGVYNLIDADSNQLVLNGTSVDGNTPNSKVVHEDGNNVGAKIITDSIQTTSGQVFDSSENIVSESSMGGALTLQDSSGKLMSEAAAGVSDTDRENLFIRMLKVKISVPKPRALNSVGLSSMGISDMFSDAFGATHIQLEDALRKRGPTINASRLVLDGLDVGGKDDPLDVKNQGEAIEMEVSQAVNLGSGLKFSDFNKKNTWTIDLEDGTGSIYLEDYAGGFLVSEDEIVSPLLSNFLEQDILLRENDIDHVSDWGRLQLNRTAVDSDDEFDFIVLNAIDATGRGDGDYVLKETYSEYHKSVDGDLGGLGILTEDSDQSGKYQLENPRNFFMLYDGIYSETQGWTDDGTPMTLEDGSNLLTEVTDPFGISILLEEGSATTSGSKLLLDSQRLSLEDHINDGHVPDSNWGDNSYYPEFTRPTEIKIRPVGRISLQDERAITELVLDSHEVSTGPLVVDSQGDNIIFDRTTLSGDDIGDKVMVESNAEVILDQCAGGMLLDADGGMVSFEEGTHASLIATGKAFLPLGAEAETFDNETRTTFDSTNQTYDVVEGS